MPPPRPAGRFHQLGAALTVPNFRRYVSGQALSLIGTWVETVAQGLLVLQLTHSGVLLGLTTATRYAPVLILSPYAGLLVDRFSKRRVLLVTQSGLGLVSLLLGLAVLTDHVAAVAGVRPRRCLWDLQRRRQPGPPSIRVRGRRPLPGP